LLAVFLLLNASCRAEEPWPLWESYTAKFLDGQGRVIDHDAEDRTTTEGQAYAMFFALVAGDRPRFDKLVDWTEANLAQGDLTLHLPAWNWGKASDGNWHVLDANPAADADLWMAYALCEAGRLWKDERYAKLGGVIADRVAEEEIVRVPGLGSTLLPGVKGFHPDDKTWFLNPSYMPPQLLAYFAHRKPQSAWKSVAASLPVLASSPGGYVMDWLKADGSTVTPSLTPAAAQEGKKDAPAAGSYDAIRMYLWVGIADPKTPGVQEALARMTGMETYLQSHLAPPLRVDSSGKVLDADGPAGFSAAVIPYLHALNLKKQEAEQSDRLGATHDTKSGLYGRSGEYFDQNLALFEAGWVDKRFRFDTDGRLRVKWR
jgi:endoglucanase